MGTASVHAVMIEISRIESSGANRLGRRRGLLRRERSVGRERRAEARLRIDQEIRRSHDVFAGRESGENLDLPVALGADDDLARLEATRPVANEGDLSRTRVEQLSRK